MKKQQHGDIKSNLNTSCASDLHSSVLSSMYQFNVGESLAKIGQLKQLYLESCEEQVALKRENQQLSTMLQRVKREVSVLIQNNFSNQKIIKNQIKNHEHQPKPPKQGNKPFKPGSIAKISKQNISISSSIIPDQMVNNDHIFQIYQPSNLSNNSNNQSSLNISAKTSRILIGSSSNHQKSGSNLVKPESYYSEHILKSGKSRKNIEFVTHHWQSVNPVQNDNPHCSQSSLKNKKTYLTSPRNQPLHSPRNIFMA